MSNNTIIQYFQNRPFVPFAIVTADGRHLEVKHPEQAMFGVRGETVLLMHDDSRLEIIESSMIVSLVTLRGASFESFGNM